MRAAAAGGVTLIELLVAMAVLGVVLSLVFAIQADAHRHARAMEMRALGAELARSGAELLVAGGPPDAVCAALPSALREAGFACEVVTASCDFGAWCTAAADLRPYLVAVTDPEGARHVLPVLARAAPHRGVEDPG